MNYITVKMLREALSDAMIENPAVADMAVFNIATHNANDKDGVVYTLNLKSLEDNNIIIQSNPGSIKIKGIKGAYVCESSGQNNKK